MRQGEDRRVMKTLDLDRKIKNCRILISHCGKRKKLACPVFSSRGFWNETVNLHSWVEEYREIT